MRIGKLLLRIIDTLRPRSVFLFKEGVRSENTGRPDIEDPSWDRNARIASATSAFESGMTRALIFKIYGEDVATEAERLHRERFDKKDR